MYMTQVYIMNLLENNNRDSPMAHKNATTLQTTVAMYMYQLVTVYWLIDMVAMVTKPSICTVVLWSCKLISRSSLLFQATDNQKNNVLFYMRYSH